MALLDTKTIWLALAVSGLLFGLLMLVYAHGGRDRSTLRLWAAAQMVRGLGICLVIIKAHLPYPWSFSGNSIYLIGHCLELTAFLSYAGRGEARRAAWAVLASVLVIYNIGVALIPSGAGPGQMAALYSGCLAVLFTLEAGAVAWAKRRRSAVQLLLVGSNALLAVTSIIRAIAAWNSDNWVPGSADLANQALFMAGFVFSITDGFGFLLLVKEDGDRDLLRMATMDDLTGLNNRAAFLAQAEDRRRLCQRSGQPATIIMIDVDHFKGVNDTYGHAAGDEVLRMIGRVMREQLRDVDAFGRLGGEEFAVALPGASLAAALPVAERLRAAIESETVSFNESEICVTASLGLADLGGERRLESAMSEADAKLYQAKAMGRNRVAAVA